MTQILLVLLVGFIAFFSVIEYSIAQQVSTSTSQDIAMDTGTAIPLNHYRSSMHPAYNIEVTPNSDSINVTWHVQYSAFMNVTVKDSQGTIIIDEDVYCDTTKNCTSVDYKTDIYRVELPSLINGVEYDVTLTTYSTTHTIGGLRTTTIGQVTFSAIPGTPHAPYNTSATFNDHAFIITWDTPASNGFPITEYILEYVVTDRTGLSSPGVTYTLSPINTFTKSDIAKGSTYHVKVSAVNSNGTGPSSEVIVQPITIPSQPVQLSANPQDAHVILQWNPPDDDGGVDITQYVIVARIGDVNPFSRIGTVSGDARTFVADNLTNNISYQFTIHAVNSVGVGASSNIVTAIPGIVPSAPQNLTGTHDGSYLNLKWDAPDNAQEANIQSYVITTRELKYGSLHNFGTATISSSHTEQRIWHPYSGTFHITIHAVNEINQSPQSQELVIKTQKRLS